MAEFQKIIKDVERMCEYYNSRAECGTDKCLMYERDLCYSCAIASFCNSEKAGKLEDVATLWVTEHPEPMIKAIPFEWFYEQIAKYPESFETRVYELVLKDYLKQQGVE